MMHGPINTILHVTPQSSIRRLTSKQFTIPIKGICVNWRLCAEKSGLQFEEKYLLLNNAIPNFYVLLTVHLSIILLINQHYAQNLVL